MYKYIQKKIAHVCILTHLHVRVPKRERMYGRDREREREKEEDTYTPAGLPTNSFALMFNIFIGERRRRRRIHTHLQDCPRTHSD